MKSKIFFAPFERKLREPFRYGQSALVSRRGFLISMGAPGEGLIAEASPLPGHSSDSFEQVETALLRGGAPTPALEFALSCLENSVTGPHEVRSNCLVPFASAASAERALEDFLQRGFTHCKLKLNPENALQVPQLIRSFPRARYRLDANQSLSPDLLSALLKELEAFGLLSSIDYIEEPYSGFWNERFPHPGVSFAADESAALALLSPHNPPSVLILKPTVQGSLEKLPPLMLALEDRGIRTVLTSALEAEPARRALQRFLSCRPHEVAGLSTGFLFSESYMPDRPALPEVTGPSEAEQAWVRSLRWREAAQ